MKNTIKTLATIILMAITVFGSTVSAKEVSLGNNELKAGYIKYIKYSKNPESKFFEESADIIIFNIDDNDYVVKDYAEDMEVNDWCLIMINTKGTKSTKDDIVLDWRAYVDYQDGEFVYEPIQK